MEQLPHVAALLAHSRPAAHDQDDGQASVTPTAMNQNRGSCAIQYRSLYSIT